MLFRSGAQRIIWGRTDEFSPTDRLSTRDYTRLVLDPLEYRRRASPALRIEWAAMNRELDLVYLPRFREAELPGADSIWFPVDRASGAVVGLPLPEALQPALRGARVDNAIDGDPGYAVRYAQTGASWDFAVTAQRVHNPEPYFTLVQAPTPTRPAQLAAVYPRGWVLGGDAGMALGAYTLRAEAAWLEASPYTRADSFALGLSEELNWALGVDAFPGDGDLRVTAQVTGRHLLDADNPVDFEDILTLLGDVETPLIMAGRPWRVRLRYSFRLDEHGSYLNPELVFTGWEPSELYLGAHLFDGDYGTAEDFYGDRDMAVIGWRARF